MKKLLEAFIIWRYTRWGIDFGEWESYAIGHEKNPCVNRLRFWENRYKALGYTPLGLSNWIDWGGYGQDQSHMLRLTKKPLLKTHTHNSMAP